MRRGAPKATLAVARGGHFSSCCALETGNARPHIRINRARSAASFQLHFARRFLMTIVRYEPWALVSRFHQQLDRALNKDADSVDSASVSWIPHVDIHEEAERFVVVADVPGVEPKDIEITAEKGVLTVRGERRSEKKTLDRRLRARRACQRHVPAPLHPAGERRRRGHQGHAREWRARALDPQAPAGAAAAHQRTGRLRAVPVSRQRTRRALPAASFPIPAAAPCRGARILRGMKRAVSLP